MRNIFKIGMLVYIALQLTGCSGLSPQVYKETIKTDQALTDSEKYSLIAIVLQENIDRLGLSRSRINTEYRGSNCVKYTLPNYHYKYYYNNCFDVEGDIFYRLDNSKCLKDRRSCEVKYLEKSQKYINFIDQFQKNVLKEKYLVEEKNYKKFLSYYNKALLGLKEKKENLKIILKDKSNVLDSEILDAINKPEITTLMDTLTSNKDANIMYEEFRLGNDGAEVLNDIDTYFADGKKLSDKFYIKIHYKNVKYDKYYLNYTNQFYKKGYLDFKDNTVLTIKNVEYNYIPEIFKFYSENKDLEITVSYIKGSYDFLPEYTFTIKNNRETSVEISDPNYYYGEKVQNSLLSLNGKKIIIAPMSKYSTVIQLNQLGRYIPVQNKDQKIKFGFYLEYKYATDSKIKTIYHVKNMTITK